MNDVIYEVLWVDYDSEISYGYYSDEELAEKRLAEVIEYTDQFERAWAMCYWYRVPDVSHGSLEEFVQKHVERIQYYPSIVVHEFNVDTNLDVSDTTQLQWYLDQIEINKKYHDKMAEGTLQIAVESQSTE